MLNIKPKECDICHDPIGLYKPWYTVRVSPHLKITTRLKNNPTVLCPDCFHAYEDFFIELEVQENHKKHYKDVKGET